MTSVVARVGARVEPLEDRRLFAYTQPAGMPVVVEWGLDTTSTSTPRTSPDQSGYANTLTLSGTAVSPAAGRVGSSLRFGSGAFSSGTDTLTAAVSGSFTISLWVNPTSATNATLASATATGGTTWSLNLTAARAVTFTLGTQTIATVGALVPLNNWTQVVAVVRYTAASGVATSELFVNGGTTPVTNPTTGIVDNVNAHATGSTTLALAPGVTALTVGSGLTGSLDAIRLYRTALSDSAVHYQWRVDSIQESDGVSANTPAWLLAKSALDWSVENAISGETSGISTFTSMAVQDYQDVVAGLARGTNLFQIGQLNPTTSQYRFLYPTMDRTTANVAYTNAQSQIASWLTTAVRFARDNADVKWTGGDGLDTLENLSELAWAFGDPDNATYFQSGAVVKPVFRRLQKFLEEQVAGQFLGDFGMSDSAVLAYWIMDKTFPNLIPPSRKKWDAPTGTQTYSQALTANRTANPNSWNVQLRFNADAIYNDPAVDIGNTPDQPQYTSNGQRFEQGGPATVWWNADVRLVAALLYSQHAFGVTSYEAGYTRHLQQMYLGTYPDGGQTYIWNQNDVVTYHNYNIDIASRLHQVSAGLGTTAGVNPTIATTLSNMIAASAWYYPLTVEPWGQGLVEHGTNPSWKHYWNTNNGSEQAAITAYYVATVSGNTQAANANNSVANLALVGTGGVGSSYNWATYWTRPATMPGGATWTPVRRAAVRATDFADNFVAYDANVVGGRGRFGAFSWSTTAANVQTPAMNKSSNGKASFVGAMLADTSSTNSWPLSAALDMVQVRVQTASAFNATAGTTDPDNASYADGAAAERTVATVAPDFSTLSTTYQPANRSQTANLARTTWNAQQDWMNTSRQVAGVVQMSGTYASGQFSAQGLIKLTSGRNSWGVLQTLTDVTTLAATPAQQAAGMRVWRFGNLMAAVTPISGINTTGIYTGSTFTWQKGESPLKSTQIILPDVTALSTAARPSGTASGVKYTLQVYPANTSLANPSTTPVPGTLTQTTLANLPDATNPANRGALTQTELTEAGVTRRMLSNAAPGGSTLNLVYTLPVGDTAFPNGVVVYSAGEQHVPAGSKSTTGLPLNATDFRGVLASPSSATYRTAYYVAPGGAITVPANTHVVLVRPTAPTITAPVATPAAATGTTTTLSVPGGTEVTGESALRYTWNVVGTPPAAVSFSAANTNAAKSVTATFARAGSYTFNVTATNEAGLSVTSTNVTVVVSQTASRVDLVPTSATAGVSRQVRISATTQDQFGRPMSPQPTVGFSIDSGGGSLTSSGATSTRYTAPATATTAIVRATVGAVSSTVTIGVIAPPRFSSFTINDGSLQRSMVRSLVLRMTAPVSLAASAITLTRRTTEGFAPTFSFVVTPSPDQMAFTITFAGAGAIGGSLPDGTYDLFLRGTGVTDAAGQTLVGGHRTFSFTRIFGDGDGDLIVRAPDLSLFQSSFNKLRGESGYLWYFDHDDDGDIDEDDRAALMANFGRRGNTGVVQPPPAAVPLPLPGAEGLGSV